MNFFFCKELLFPNGSQPQEKVNCLDPIEPAVLAALHFEHGVKSFVIQLDLIIICSRERKNTKLITVSVPEVGPPLLPRRPTSGGHSTFGFPNESKIMQPAPPPLPSSPPPPPPSTPIHWDPEAVKQPVISMDELLSVLEVRRLRRDSESS